MKRLAMTVLTAIGFSYVSSAAFAQTSARPAQSNAKSWSKADVDKMCDRPTETPVPEAGYQYDGQKASDKILQMASGKYAYPNGGAMLVWPDARYLIKLPSTRKGVFGTDGDDLLASGGIVGGCSREQLSEAIRKNELRVENFMQVKAYK